MKFYPFLMAFILVPYIINSQTAFHNFGNIEMHSDSEIGFHTDVINDGDFENESGFVGFYSDSATRIVSGTNRPIFYNVEIDAINDLQLENSLGIRNNLDFINGKVITPRDNVNISLDFINFNLYVGEDNDRHTDGYASVFGDKEFSFPIGNNDKLRPMIIPPHSQNNYFRGAYFSEDPNTPTTFLSSFDTTEKQILVGNVSNYEFWDLDGTTETVVTLTWDQDSNIDQIASNTNLLTVVGWSKSENQWVNLGGINITGDLISGQLTSETFIPDEYEVITIGSILQGGDLADDNFLISPNGDNVNDTLVFEGLELYKNNKLSIFNRWGNTVLEVDNYKNDWEGISQGPFTVDKSDGLPVGTYFYVLSFGNDSLDRTLKGWVYINR
ncbi:gliding motility-associated C-terminal domain-containing protein [Tenacibaculum amylolyticum]|uniref:gliding motility-associated C-terminal domain-containing protein n=1 Tax=Tenacibaculum amylolyticum TaxID=104269 RepID=UPI0038957636